MSVFTRFKDIFQSQVNELAMQLEDHRASLDYALARLEEDRRELVRSLVEIGAAKRRLESQRDNASAIIRSYAEQAGASLKAGREELARRALERKQAAENRRLDLEDHITLLEQQEAELKVSQASLDDKIASLRSKNEELKSVLVASRAQLRLREAFSGISGSLFDIGNAIQRAEARIQEMQSRAAAIENLLAEGVLPDVLGSKDEGINRELNSLRRSQLVEEELARLKSETGL